MRNEVDLISNGLSLNWDNKHPIGSIFSEARVASDALPTLLHELTHWQCCQTMVGGTFRSLWDVIARGSWKSEVTKSISEGQVPDHYLRLLENMIIGLLVYLPWIEGLALFAEWDALPGRSTVISSPMRTALIVRPDLAFTGTLDDALGRLGTLLRDARRGPEAERQKIDLLSLPLFGPQGHYLAGYLGIKALYKKAVSASALFQDTDFFLAFAIARIFFDPRAAAILLDTETPSAEWADQLVMRLVERIRVFSAADLDKFAKLYEQSEQSSPQREQAATAVDLRSAKFRDELPKNLFDQLREAPPGHELLNESMELDAADWDLMSAAHLAALLPYMSKPTVPRNRTLYSQSLSLRHRNMIRLRRVVALPRIDGEHVFFDDDKGNPLGRCRKSDNVTLPAGEAVYLLYFDPTARCLLRLALAYQGKEAILLGVEAVPRANLPLNPDQIRYLVEAIIVGENHEQRRFKPGGMDQMMQILDATLSLDIRERVVKKALDIALVPVMVGLSEKLQTSLVDGLSTNGIFGLVGKQRPTVDAVAKISLLASEQLSFPQIRRAMADDDQTADGILGILDNSCVGPGCFYSHLARDGTDFLVLGL